MKKSLSVLTAIVALIITIPLACSDTTSIQEERTPNIHTFTNSEEFKNLVIATEQIIDIQTAKFLKLSNDQRDKYIAKLNKLTQLLEKNPSKNTLTKFVNHTGFNGVEHYLSLYNEQVNMRKTLKKEFPDYANLKDGEKNVYLKKAWKEYEQNVFVDSDDVAYFGPCEDQLEAKRTAATGVAVGALLTCGKAAGAVSLAATPLAGGIFYGICAGAVYATLNAKFNQYQAEYEMCNN